jgi:hypothetical protein
MHAAQGMPCCPVALLPAAAYQKLPQPTVGISVVLMKATMHAANLACRYACRVHRKRVLLSQAPNHDVQQQQDALTSDQPADTERVLRGRQIDGKARRVCE